MVGAERGDRSNPQPSEAMSCHVIHGSNGCQLAAQWMHPKSTAIDRPGTVVSARLN